MVILAILALSSSIPLFSQGETVIDMKSRLAYDRKPGFVSITELTGGTGLNLTDAPYAKYYMGVTSTAGYQFTANIEAGAGTGILFHNAGTFIPLFLDARFSFGTGVVMPYLTAAGGLSFNLSDEGDRTWIFLNPAVGVRWVAADRRSFSFSAGLMTMSGNVNRNSFISFRLGIGLRGK
jgi:hypothetical protein